MSTIYSLALDILLQSPLHISAVEPGRYRPDTGRIVRGGGDDSGLACTLTRTMEIARAAPLVVRMEHREVTLNNVVVPTIPANTIGGLLRRKATTLIAESLVARNLTLTVRAFNTLSAGTADASLATSGRSVALVGIAKRDAYLAVFGGTSFGLTKGLRVYEGMPVTEDTLPLLYIPQQTASVYGSDRLTGVVHFTKKDDVLDLRNPELLERTIGLEPVSDYITSIMKGRNDKKARRQADDDSGKKTELATHAAFEVVRPGLHFALRFRLKTTNEAALGLLLLTLKRFCDEGQVGGKANAGCGQFAVTSARLFPHNGLARALTGIELWHRTPSGLYQFSDAPFVRDAVKAGEDYVDNLEPDLIEAFASGNVKAIDRKAA